jgi:hypothetical protein
MLYIKEEVKMDNRIEIIDRRRKRLVIFILVGFGIWYGILLAPAIYRGIGVFLHGFGRARLFPFPFLERFVVYYYYAGLLIFLLFAFYLLIWVLYKNTLKKDPALRAAINDELVKQNWLKAYRFSFFCTTALAVFLVIIRILDSHMKGRLAGIEGLNIHLILYTAVMSCLGAFLYYNRER